MSENAHLQYASDELKADREVVLAAVNHYGPALEYASDDLKADKEIVLEAVKLWGSNLEYASDDLKADKDVVLAAVTNTGRALEYASDNLKADREIVLEAVKHKIHASGHALTFASATLRREREIALAAMHSEALLSFPVDFLIEEKKLFHNETNDWEHYFYTPGYLRVFGEVWFDAGGIAGNLGLWIPPKDHDQDDLWEGSRSAGESDWWSFIQFTTVPGISVAQEEFSTPVIIIFFNPCTFFDRNNEVLKIINTQDIGSVDGDDLYSTFSDRDDPEELYDAWLCLWKIFEECLGAKSLD